MSNSGSGHPLTRHFAVFGYHMGHRAAPARCSCPASWSGRSACSGCACCWPGARRTSRRGHEARRGLDRVPPRPPRRHQDRDDLLGQRETARAYTASTLGDGAGGDGPGRDPGADAAGGQRSKWHLFGPRPASAQAAAPPVQAVNGPAPDIPAPDAPASDVPADASAAAD